MRQRVAALVGPVAQKMWVSTFHSACVRILRRDAEALGYPSSFTIYDQADAVRLTGYVHPRPQPRPEALPAPLACTPRSARPRTSCIDRRGVRGRGAASSSSASIADVYREYQARLHARRRHGLRRPARRHRRLFREHPDVLEHYRSASSTCWSTSTRTPTPSRTSSSLLLAAEHRNVCVVGDTRSVDLPLPRRRHPQHPRVRGGVPRRHRGRARAELPVDADDPRRRQRGDRQQPRPQAEGAVDRPGRRRQRSSATTPTTRCDEAQWVAHEIAGCTTAATRWGDIAVFYRTNAQSRVVEEHAHAARHPVQGRRRHPLLRPARGQGRARLPARRS